LAGRLAGTVDVEDLPLLACSIQELASLLLFGEWAREQIVEKEGAQSFNRFLGQSCQTA
jgi:hypothetical protein